MKSITCDNCLKTFSSASLRRVCGNCFLCTGCEIYRCPKCQEEIIITPLEVGNYGQVVCADDEPDN